MPRGVYKRKKAEPVIIENAAPETETFSDADTVIIEANAVLPKEVSITRGWCDKCQHGHDLVDGECTR